MEKKHNSKPFTFDKPKKISIKVHFDMYHGFGNLDKAIDLLNDKDERNLDIMLKLKFLSIHTICLFVKVKQFYLNITIQFSMA